jgi:molecular chaperone DnaK (HSP70)
MIDKWSPYVFGIDLGTSFSEIAIYRKGRSEVLKIDGEEKVASVMTVLKTGEILVGREARARMMIDPENTVASIKREMGTEWTKVFEGLPDKTYKPEDIQTEVLTKLINGARESGVNLRGTPRFVVICVPANFTDPQKKATLEAGAKANLEVLYLLEEPVAAALAYAFDQSKDQTILVYDLGGGTFDVAILKVNSTKTGLATFEFLAKAGVPRLGGDDFDWKIMEIAAAKLKETSGIDLLDLKKDQGISKRALGEAQQKLKDAAETAKRELVEAQTTTISIPSIIKDEQGNVHNLEVEITREQFETAVGPLIQSSKEAVERALADAKLSMPDISRIILVGGSTHVPLVKKMLSDMFGKDPYGDLNPDTVVARGAAIYGAHLGVPAEKTEETAAINSEDKPEGSVIIHNIVTHFLGIELVDGKFGCILEKDQEIPADKPLAGTKEYVNQRDNQTELRITVYQSESKADVVSVPGVVCIGELFVPIAPKPRGQEKAAVTFELDQQNLLKVKVTTSLGPSEIEIKR